MYADHMRNPKVAALSDRDYRTWVGLLAVAAENDGLIPPLDALKRLLMMRLDHLSSALDRLAKARLIDVLASGYEPHSWHKFQYKSDTSTARVTLHRERVKHKSETPPETDTEAETDKGISNDIPTRARRAAVSKPDDVSDATWRDFGQHRKAKKAPVTQSALDGIRREAGKAGWAMDAALAEICARGWTGFKAEWVSEGNNGNGQLRITNGASAGGNRRRNGRDQQSATGYGRTADALARFVEEAEQAKRGGLC